uniref:Uncharacterized protein n=1 Tax=Cannabis sativa TaxID=3483 RepID=A0A803QT41_CANSA
MLGLQSLCNACGIRQRKARRAMAAAAAAAAGSTNGTVVPVDKPSMKNTNKEKKSKSTTTTATNNNNNNCVPFKKRCQSRGRRKNKVCFEDLIVSVSKNTSAFQRVFPQDERDAAILLMALSYGLVHG